MAEKDRVRTEQFRFTLLPEENAMLTKNAFEYGLSKSEYLRKLILAESLSGKQWHMDRDQAKQLIYEVNRIGNNVNQIAYNTNAVRFSSNKDWGELQTKYFELMTLFCQFALAKDTAHRQLSTIQDYYETPEDSVRIDTAKAIGKFLSRSGKSDSESKVTISLADEDFAKKLEEVASDSAGKQMLEFAIAMYEKNNSGK